jgi:hypothetical protein
MQRAYGIELAISNSERSANRLREVRGALTRIGVRDCQRKSASSGW